MLKSVYKSSMDNSTSVCDFFESSTKRKKYFESFLEFYKADLNLPEINCKEIIELSNARWVERYKDYDIYHLCTKQQFLFLSQSKK